MVARIKVTVPTAGLTAIALVSLLLASSVEAQQQKGMTPELEKVRAALDKYQDPIVAVHDGYFSTVGCVEYPKRGGQGQVPYVAGGMGVHFFNVGLMGKLDPFKPQVLVYEPVGDKLRLVAAEYFVPLTPDLKERPGCSARHSMDRWKDITLSCHTSSSTTICHVWLWKSNPAGVFASTNPDLKCPKAAIPCRRRRRVSFPTSSVKPDKARSMA
jgi:hypothetical protein